MEKKVAKFSLIKRMKKWIEPHFKTFLLCLFLLLMATAIKIIGPVIIQQAVDGPIKNKDIPKLLILLGGYITILLIGYWANYQEIVRLETVGQTIVANIKKQAFKHLLTLNMGYFDKSTTGNLVSRVENDSNAMLVLFTSIITNFVGSLILLIGMLCIMFIKYSSVLAFSLLAFVPFMLFGAYIFAKIISPKLIDIRKYVADVNSYITEIIQGISIIQIFGQEKRVLNELKIRSKRKYDGEKVTTVMFNTFFNVLFFVNVLGTVAVLFIGTEMVIKKQMTVGGLILFINFISQFFMPIIQLSGQFSEFQRGFSGAIRVFDLLDTENAIPDVINALNIPEKEKGINIEFKNVWFKYNDESDWVLKDLSFYCPSGENWAIVGPTGSGKTTIISLLLKFYLPQKGEILLNGVNISEVSKEELRSTIGLVLQENILFPGTIYENLTLKQNHYTDSQVKLLMKDLGIDSVIAKLQNGYDTELNDNASNLSAGEKQLISFGRALLKNPSILIFDEATSNIDPEIENNIKQAMNKLIKGRTALIIAHRLSTIQSADKIMVLKNGHLIEIGNHNELIKTGGFYSQLNMLQVS